MTTRDDEPPDGLDIADDPTGMRDLLGSLPDPGPMPADIVLAISNALAKERTPLADVVPITPVASSSTPRVLPLGRYLGAAAAAAALVGVGLLGLTEGGHGMVSALMGGHQDSASSAAGSEGGSALAQSDAVDGSSAYATPSVSDGSWEEKLSGNPSTKPQTGITPARSGSVQVYLSSRTYTTKDLVRDATQFARAPGDALPPLAAESPAIGPIGTPLGIEACAASAGIPSADGLLADLATFDGRPAVVIVAVRETAQTAYVVDRRCGSGSGPGATALLAGPVALPALSPPVTPGASGTSTP